MNSIRCRSAVAGVSVSSPRMMPETTSSPYSLIRATASRIGMRRFWSFDIERSASGSGVSIPQNTVMKPASRISASTRSFLAMFSVASHAKRSGIPVAALPLDQVRQQLQRGLLVADEVVVHEVDGDARRPPRSASSSASTCAVVLRRGLRP